MRHTLQWIPGNKCTWEGQGGKCPRVPDGKGAPSHPWLCCPITIPLWRPKPELIIFGLQKVSKGILRAWETVHSLPDPQNTVGCCGHRGCHLKVGTAHTEVCPWAPLPETSLMHFVLWWWWDNHGGFPNSFLAIRQGTKWRSFPVDQYFSSSVTGTISGTWGGGGWWYAQDPWTPAVEQQH